MNRRHITRAALVLFVPLVGCLGCDGGSSPPAPANPPRSAETPAEPDTGPEDDAAIRTLVAHYLGSIQQPEPTKLAREAVAPDVHAVWSDGSVYDGREAFFRALQAGIEEVRANLDSLAVNIEEQVLQRKGTIAWVYTRYTLRGTLKQGQGTLERTHHATLVLEKRKEGWQIVHELAARLTK